MKVFNFDKKIVKSWCNEPEDGAIEQAKSLANLPFIYKHVALMPDTHQGYGMPIGGVIACKEVIIPNAVGVDIGCGMLAVRTSLTNLETNKLKSIMNEIRKLIPVGFEHQKEAQKESLMPDERYAGKIVKEQYNSALKQLGTLGGGNHFIEIQKGSDGFVWFMLHSGSRNLGKKVADWYNNEAKCNNDMYFSSVPKEWDLAFLPLEDAGNYLDEMRYCLDFALANRKLISERVQEAFINILPDVSFKDEINIHHNYCRIENHFNQNVWIHRKGATSAKKGELGIIPGSQGTKSYIVEGLGNPDSFMSCSHGAGRKMGRKQAQRSLNLLEEQKKLDGILHSVRTQKDLDEASGAYKDISVVMEEQKDLVKIVTELTPLGVIKG
jgi:tRNA-splicing ligase RtcB